MGTKGKRRGYVSFLNQERNKEPACGVKATCIKLEVALATCPAPVAGKIHMSGSAQAPSVHLNISPSAVLRTSCADFIGVPREAFVECDEQMQRLMIFG